MQKSTTGTTYAVSILLLFHDYDNIVGFLATSSEPIAILNSSKSLTRVQDRDDGLWPTPQFTLVSPSIAFCAIANSPFPAFSWLYVLLWVFYPPSITGSSYFRCTPLWYTYTSPLDVAILQRSERSSTASSCLTEFSRKRKFSKTGSDPTAAHAKDALDHEARC